MEERLGLLNNWTRQPMTNALTDQIKADRAFRQEVGDDELGAYRDRAGARAWIDKQYNVPSGPGEVTPYNFTAAAGAYNPVDPTLYASLSLPINKELDFYKSFNTPLGQVELSNSDTPFSIEASLTPKNYYLQALARRLMGTDEQNI